MYYTETPHGTFTQGDKKYLTTPSLIKQLGGDTTALSQLYLNADAWLNAPMFLAVIMLPVALHLIPIPFLSLVATLLFWIWAEVSLPAKATLSKSKWMLFLGNIVFQIGWNIGLMGLLVYLCLKVYPQWYPNREITFPYEAIGISLFMFFLWRSTLLNRLFNGIFEKTREKRYPYPAEDIALHALLVQDKKLDLPQLKQYIGNVVEEANAL